MIMIFQFVHLADHASSAFLILQSVQSVMWLRLRLLGDDYGSSVCSSGRLRLLGDSDSSVCSVGDVAPVAPPRHRLRLLGDDYGSPIMSS